MDRHRTDGRQYAGYLPAPQAATSSSPPSQLRHRPSIRDRFWARTSANYDGEDDVVYEAQANPNRKSTYVPRTAASGFSRTVSAPHEPLRRRSQPGERRPSKESATNANARWPPSDLAAGHPCVHAESEPDTTDYAAFIAAAQAEERLRRAVSQRHGNSAGARSHYRDSGYYSSSNGGRHDHEPCSPSLPSSPPAAGPGRLKSQPSIRALGQRIAEYVKPLR